MADTAAISLQNVKKTFNGRDFILNGLNLEIPEGKITVLIGFSGTGKSVVLKTILGLLPPSEGEIDVLGHNVYEMRSQDIYQFRKRFGVLFQNAALFDDMTTLDNVMFPLKEHRRELSATEIEERAIAVLDQVGLDQRHF